MSHELRIEGGEAVFAYNIEDGVPWHKLGRPFEGLMSLEQVKEEFPEILTPVELMPVFAYDEENDRYVEIPERRATVRINTNGTVTPYEVFKGRYERVHDEVIMEKALNVVVAARGDAVITTIGHLYEGRRFFAVIDLGSLFIDPIGINDEIKRFLLVEHSHDGTIPVIMANTGIRVVCANTERMAMSEKRSVFKAKHTRNVENAMEEAAAALRFNVDWAREFKAKAEEMLTIQMTGRRMDRVFEYMWPTSPDDSDRKRNNRDDKIEAIKAVYGNRRNAQLVGNNGWAMWNAVVEYLDHHRGADATARALASMDHESYVSRVKVLAHEAVLASAN